MTTAKVFTRLRTENGQRKEAVPDPVDGKVLPWQMPRTIRSGVGRAAKASNLPCRPWQSPKTTQHQHNFAPNMTSDICVSKRVLGICGKTILIQQINFCLCQEPWQIGDPRHTCWFCGGMILKCSENCAPDCGVLRDLNLLLPFKVKQLVRNYDNACAWK